MNKIIWVEANGQDVENPALLLNIEQYRCHIVDRTGKIHYIDISDLMVTSINSSTVPELIFINQ